ncbi:aminotransferase class III-fold pyridoxal phosphate-dependent enzyme [Ensifer aridi]|uniref:aminotransferase class III-fold pyridoxal phosphate-dependent enzyme n=1 Tax=Ensifer aridi TaxID=1708715 RepID=UPI001FCCF075|nr:aminotransferase class III-fold pyridoxal phosphate-dependent enzyme [Ensifer aridi]
MGLGPVPSDQNPCRFVQTVWAIELGRSDRRRPVERHQGFDRLIAEHCAVLAAIIMEPVVFHFGPGRASPGHIEHVREVCTRKGIILIFDEVVWAFAFARAGRKGDPMDCADRMNDAGSSSSIAEVTTGNPFC